MGYATDTRRLIGKCYQFIGPTGRKLAFVNGQYSETIPHKEAIPGRFQFCRDKDCTPGQPVNPTDSTYIKDIMGSPLTAAGAGSWLNNAQGGVHIGKTTEIAQAGVFSITKWPCGKYCVSGFTQGLGMACPAEDPGITLYTNVAEACVEFTLVEVPCSIRSDQNNCIWKSPKKQCPDPEGENDCNYGGDAAAADGGA